MTTVLPPEAPSGIFARFFHRAFPQDRRSGTDRRVGPFRGELLGAEGLAAHARTLARRQELAEPLPRRAPRWWQRKRAPGPLLARLDDTEALLDEARTTLTEAADRGVDVSAAGDWLLDNFYVLQEHIRDVRQGLPASYYQELPKLAQGQLAGYPRVYEIAIELIAHTEGHLDTDNISLYLREFQTVALLSMGELWAVPAMLRIALVENIRRLALRVMHRLRELEAADDWAAKLQEASRTSPRALTTALGRFVDEHPRLTPTFVARLYQQLRGYQSEQRKLMWLEQWIAEESLSPEDAVSRANQRLALTQVMMANHVTSLRRIGRLDWERFFESQSVVEAILRGDPSGDYGGMTFETRDRYRHVVEDIARGAGQGEDDVARRAIELAGARPPGTHERTTHVGYWLVDLGRRVLEAELGYVAGNRERLYRAVIAHPNVAYFGSIALLTALGILGLFALAPPASPGLQALLLVLALVPASEVAIATVNQIVTLVVPPRRLPKMDVRTTGIPPDLRTVVVVPTLLPSVEVVREQLEHLEIQYLANRTANLHFAILGDFADAAEEHVAGDDEIVATAVEGIRALNAAYGDGAGQTFYFFHRPRVWSERQGVWMGWERKRGKLAAFNRFLRGGAADAFATITGDTGPLRGARYVITLDSDTVLPHDAAELLIGTLAHPLNRAVHDPHTGRVVHGYGIVQPRVGISLPSACRTRFAAIHSGHPGVDPYTTAVSDVYQDLYAEGSYTGKGIYDVDAFESATLGRFPDDALLSHDLIEGAFTRAALATDIELYDDYPASYLTHARRKHRWIRGDWQLLPWLRARIPAVQGSQPNPLSTISRWKIFDNLRRSLVEITQLALAAAGWIVLPGSLRWTIALLAAIAWPWALGLLLAAVRPPRQTSWRAYYHGIGRDAVVSAQQFALAVVFLPYQAATSADAIARTLYRLYVSRRHLLEWAAASLVERGAAELQQPIWQRMTGGTLLTIGIGVGAWQANELWSALPLLLVWLAGPWLAHRLSAPAVQKVHELDAADRRVALRYALLHWRYFETFATADTEWLAPDNFQETPEPVVAARTSATNVGLQLLSIVSARDLGFISIGDMVERLERAFRTLERLRRFRGHFFNWYSLPELKVLEPAYISAVDSGNLAGHLLALKQACLALAAAPTDADPRAAAQAAVSMALEGLAGSGAADAERELRSAASALASEPRESTGPASQLTSARRHLTAADVALTIAEAFHPERVSPAVAWIRWAGALLDAHLAEPDAGRTEELASRLRVIAQRAHAYVVEMDFSLLFDSRRKLFSIGFREAEGALDDSYYDLLASEARLGSLVAIAKNDVPPEHWFRMGRSLTVDHGATALVSWSGSMFEYLMPGLVMRSLPFTMLDQTHRSAVRRHIVYGREHGTPWGISESAYNVRDRHGTYQYRGFGVPDLALKRGLSRELVVAPYASLLALSWEPAEAMRNLAALEGLGALGPYGFRDAVDYVRTGDDGGPAIVCAYMAHHLGMGLVALANSLVGPLWHDRFHADPLVRSVELLLAERIPRRFVSQDVQPETFAETRERADRSERERPAVREFGTAATAQPAVALLGGPAYSVMVTNGGGGFSRSEQLAVLRWRPDTTRDHFGQWCYIRDVESNKVWSATHQPLGQEPELYRAVFASDRASFHRRDGDIETRLEVAVVPEDRAEVRRITITNHAWTARAFELTSYGEVVLAPPDADMSHPAFANLFVETEWIESQTAILASRRPRSAHEARIWCVHVVAADRSEGNVTFETDRSRFIGRGRSPADPAALAAGATLSGTAGSVLDPILALRVRVKVPPGRSAHVAFTTLVQGDRERAIALADRYNDLYGAQRAFDLSWTRSQMELQDIGATPADAALFQQLAGPLLYPDAALRAPAEEIARNTRTQEALWAHGLSGDLPIVLATIDTTDGLPSVRQLLRAHYFWRLHGVASDLVFLNTMAASYLQDLNEQLLAAVRASTEAGLIDQSGGVFVRRQDLIPAEDVAMLRAVARVHVECDGIGLGALAEAPPEPERQTVRRERTNGRPAERPGRRERHDFAADDRPPLALFNGLGGLTQELDYEIRMRRAELPPAPWANVVANPHAGFVVTENGGGYTWSRNSFFYRLTPWRNDPVTDAPGEAIYIRDDESGELWTPTPAPVRTTNAYVARHRAGATSFEHEHAGIRTTLTLGIAPDDPVKIALLEIENRSGAARRLTITSYVEWVLGVLRERTQEHVRTTFDDAAQAMFARNHFNPLFAGDVAFTCLSAPITSHTADRTEFLGRNGSPADPAALGSGPLGERTGAALDPCAALQCHLSMQEGGRATLVVLLGAAGGADAARALVERYRDPEAARTAVAETEARWQRRLSTIAVRTPAADFDALLNRWLPYQALACRMWGRSAVYQSSGAYGFRDQLQDGLAFVYADPDITRTHLIAAAGRQFVEGDVQHWWHPESGRGVRTLFSDDLVWLPYCADHYIRVTGDAAVLDAEAPFLRMRPLAPGEHEVYDLPQDSGERGTLYEHCLRALRRAATSGPHGLPLIGSGDWNDGMNRVGIEGRGESVWLAWFLIDTLRKFAVHAERRKDAATAGDLRARADAYAEAAERHAWDGEWYRRAYFDDGTPLGSAANEECRIDSIAQSWSVISGAGPAARTAQAMASLEQHLVRDGARLLMLLTPPFDRMEQDPGYIKGYLPGVRENGAQYTHAALWAVLATALRGDGSRAFELFQMINPFTHARTPREVAEYKVEPYVVAADVYTAEGHLGRGGWTWYTGSASWMYRVGLEGILGFRLEGDALRIDPCIPREWDEFSITYRRDGVTYEIHVLNPDRVERGVQRVTVDGEVAPDKRIALTGGSGTRKIVIELGP